MTTTTVPRPSSTDRPSGKRNVPSPSPVDPPSGKRFPLTFVVNLCVALSLLAALPIIHHGLKGFQPHARLDKEYVNAAISSGETEFLHKALKTTEMARAMAYEDQVVTMNLMQVAVAALLVLFVFNCVALFRHHRRSAAQPAAPPRRP